MVDILIEGKFLDMFPDTKVSGSYSPISENKSSGFSVPYTNKFSVPLTEHNRAILGYNKKSIGFTKEDTKGTVMIDGEEIMYGTLYIDFVQYEGLGEVAEIQVVDIVSEIINKGKNLTIGEIFESSRFKPFRYFMVGNTSFPSNCPYSYCYTEQNGYKVEGDFSFITRANADEIGQPFVFNLVDVLDACFNRFGVSLDRESLPYDVAKFDVGVSFPIAPVSVMSKRTFEPFISGKVSFISKRFKYSSNDSEMEKQKEFDEKYKDYSIPCINDTNLQGIGFIKPSRNKLASGFMSGTNPRFSRAFSPSKFMLKPKLITIGDRPASNTILVREYEKYEATPVNTIEERDFELWVYVVDFSGEIVNRYKIADVETDIDGYISKTTITDDYLYAKMIEPDTASNLRFTVGLHSKGQCNITVGSARASIMNFYADSVVNSTTTSNPYFISFNYNIRVDFEYIEAEEDWKKEFMKANNVIQREYLKTYKEGVSSTVDEFSQYRPTQDGRIVDMKSSLEYTDIKISDFVSDFLKRFNLKASSTSGKVMLTPMVGGDSYSIDITPFISSDLVAAPIGDDEDNGFFKVENGRYGLYKDKFFDGTSFADSRKVVVNENIDKGVTVSLNSSIIPTVVSGEPVKTMSDSVAELVRKYGNVKLGLSYYEAPKRSEYGTRFGYLSSSKTMSPLVAVSVGDNDEEVENLDTIYEQATVLSGGSFTTYVSDPSRLSSTKQDNISIYSGNNVLVGSIKAIICGGIIFFYNMKLTNPAAVLNDEIFFNKPSIMTTPPAGYGAVRIPYIQSYTKQFLYLVSNNHFVKRPDINTSGIDVEENNGKIKITGASKMGGYTDLCITAPLADGSTTNLYEKNIYIPYGKSGFVTNPSFTISNASFKTFVPLIYNAEEDRYDTLSFSNLGITAPTAKTISNAYDKYFGEYEASVLAKSSMTLEFDAYLTKDNCKKIMDGARISLYGKDFALISAEGMDFTNHFGGISRIKIAKISSPKSGIISNFITADGKIIRLADGKIFNVKQL